MNLRKLLLPVLASMSFLVTLAVDAQLHVQFVPARNGQNLQGLSLAQIQNSSVFPVRVSLTVKVKEMNSGNVLAVKTPGFVLHSGLNIMDRVAFSNAAFTFAPNFFGSTVKQTGNFPEGEYEYCFELEVLETKDLNLLPSYEQCFTYQLQPLTPLLLIQPVDQDVTCNKRPAFTWQPPFPLSPDARFRLILAEVKEKQEPIEAITFNTPIINQAEISINNLFYPVNIPDLKEGGRYAWQVTVYSGRTILRKSEIWTFAINCVSSSVEPESGSYRELKEADDGNFYIAQNYLRFSLINPYAGGPLSYTIQSVSNPNTLSRKLPKLSMAPGLNKFDIDLTEIGSLKANEEYLLKVVLPDNRQLKLRFIYKKEVK